MAASKASAAALFKGGVWRRIPPTVWALGVTSLLMDTASEAIHSLLPVFIVSVLGASPALLGFMEGVAEGLTAVTKLFSGVLSDRLKARKSITIAGYSLAALSKPIFAMATSMGWVWTARLIDRFGKGIRGAPRDALIADLVAPEVRGAAFGLRQALDTVGAVLGPLSAMFVLVWLEQSLRSVFWITVIPAGLSVLVLVFAVKEPPQEDGKDSKNTTPFAWSEVVNMPRAFWAVVGAGGALTMARFSEAFLVLRAQDQGMTLAYLPLVLVTMNVVYAGVAYPAGVLADRAAPHKLLAGGAVVLIAADVAMGLGGSISMTFIGIALWGLHMALTQGLLSALVAAVAPAGARASAFGLFNLIMGLVTVVSSTLAGVLWEQLGPKATFVTGGGFAVLALVGAGLLAPFLKAAGSPSH